MKKILLALCFVSVSIASHAQTWSEQATGFSTPTRGLSEIKIVDANTVWATAYDGATTTNNIQEFTRTIDGGANWITGTINVGNTAFQIGNLTAVSATNAWVSAFNTTTGGGGVWNTTDGGATWNQQNATGFTGASSWCDGVHFFDANIGIAFGDPLTTQFEVYRTTDGGANWATVSTPTITTGDYGYSGSFATYGDSMWFTTAKGKIYRTTDKGATWVKLNSPIADFGAGLTTTSSGKLYFSDTNNGIIIGSTISGTGTTATVTGRTIYRTTNGGTTWSAGVAYTQPYNSSIAYVPGTLILVGIGATVSGTTTTYSSAYSLDNAATWTQIDSGTQRTVVAVLDGTTAWAGGFNSDPFTKGIYKLSANLSKQIFTSSKNFIVAPNPVSSVLTISSTNGNDYSIKVADLSGKIVIEKSLNGFENNVDVSSLTTGAYLVTLSTDKATETIKILKN